MGSVLAGAPWSLVLGEGGTAGGGDRAMCRAGGLTLCGVGEECLLAEASQDG